MNFLQIAASAHKLIISVIDRDFKNHKPVLEAAPARVTKKK